MPSRRQFLTGFGSASLPALAGCVGGDADVSPGTDANADWPTVRFDRRNTAYNPDAKAPREGVAERWTYSDGMASGTPAVADGTVLLPMADGLTALDAANGERMWRFSPGDGAWMTNPAVHDGTVFVTAVGEDSLYAIDADSGKERWSLGDETQIDSAVHLVSGEHISNPVLYAGTDDDQLVRIDADTGEVDWREEIFGTVSALGYHLPTLYVGTEGGEVYAFYDSVDGVESPGESWRQKVGSKIEAILPTQNGILVQTFAGPLQNLGDGPFAGTTQWTVNQKRANSPPVKTRSSLFTAGYESLSTFHDHDGEPKWRLDGRYDATGPVAAGDTLYASSGDAVHAFALDGGIGGFGVRFDAKRWSHPTPAGAVEGLSVADGAVFAACQGSKKSDVSLYCLESR